MKQHPTLAENVNASSHRFWLKAACPYFSFSSRRASSSGSSPPGNGLHSTAMARHSAASHPPRSRARGGGCTEPWMSKPARARRCAAPAIFRPRQSRSDFSAPAKQLPGNFFLTRSSQRRRHVEPGEGGADPFVQAPVTFRRLEPMPVVLRRKYQAVGPVPRRAPPRPRRSGAAPAGAAGSARRPGCIFARSQTSPPAPSNCRSAAPAAPVAGPIPAGPRPAPCCKRALPLRTRSNTRFPRVNLESSVPSDKGS